MPTSEHSSHTLTQATPSSTRHIRCNALHTRAAQRVRQGLTGQRGRGHIQLDASLRWMPLPEQQVTPPPKQPQGPRLYTAAAAAAPYVQPRVLHSPICCTCSAASREERVSTYVPECLLLPGSKPQQGNSCIASLSPMPRQCVDMVGALRSASLAASQPCGLAAVTPRMWVLVQAPSTNQSKCKHLT